MENPDSETSVVLERALLRTAKIKRHGAEPVDRPVVALTMMMGYIELAGEFTLADRSQYSFPVLIGRNVLSGKYLVDVNRKYTILRISEREA